MSKLIIPQHLEMELKELGENERLSRARDEISESPEKAIPMIIGMICYQTEPALEVFVDSCQLLGLSKEQAAKAMTILHEFLAVDFALQILEQIKHHIPEDGYKASRKAAQKSREMFKEVREALKNKEQ